MESSFKRVIIFLAILLIFLTDNALSLDKDTHKFLNETIAGQGWLDNYLRNNLGLKDGIKEAFKGIQVLRWIADGGKEEDEPLYLRSRNHFHNPLKSWNTAGLTDYGSLTSLGFTPMSSVLWAQDQSGASWIDFGGDWSWKKSREYFYQALTGSDKATREDNFANTFRSVGQIMHLVEDSSVPAHARNDTHIWGDGYEEWVRGNHGLLKLSPITFVTSIFNESANSHAPIPIAKIFDTDKYTGTNPSTSLSWGIAEYTNSNFASDDTIFTENFDPNHKHYFPYPRYSPDNYEMYEIDIPPNKKRIYLRKKGDGESIERFATAGPLYKYLSFDPALQRYELKLDSEVHSDYAKKLIPRAVGYSAGLLNYFFRGDIDMIPDDTTGSGYVIVNNIDDDMDGTFELWYDDSNDTRKMTWSGSYSIGRKSSDNNKSTNITFTPPTDAKEPDRYMLVFKGKLGNEEGAVVGLELMERQYLFLVNIYKQIRPFEIKVINNQYQLVPASQVNISMYGYDSSSRNLTVQSDLKNSTHAFSYPGLPSMWSVSCSYEDKVLNYGLKRPSSDCYYGTSYVSRPPIGFMTLYDKDGDYSIYAFGRHNYTLDNDGKMITYNDSIWRDNTTGDYIYRYKTDYAGEFTNGEVVATDQSGVNTIIAALGNGKVIKVETERLDDGFKSQERFIGQTVSYSYTFEYCYDDSIKWYIYTISIEGEIVVHSVKIKNKEDTTRQFLKVSGNIIDAVESSNSFGHDGHEYIDTNITNSNISRSETSYPCQSKGVISSSPKEIVLTNQEAFNKQSGTIKVHDYDNFNGDMTWMILYEKNEVLTNSAVNADFTYPLNYGVDHPGAYPGIPLVTQDGQNTTSSTVRYVLAYKTTNGNIQKTILEEISTSSGNYPTNILTGFSCQLNKDIMVYTYIRKKWDGSEYIFDKRIVGVINAAGRQEFTINSEDFPIEDFDFTQLSGIGIHKIQLK